LDASLVLDLIRDAKAIGVRTIGFTGGEPFLRPKELALFHSEAKGLGLETIIITSAFFASSEERALTVLKPFSGVDMLGISTDVYHRNFMSTDRVRFAIRAARQLRVPRVEVQVAFASNADYDATVALLDKDADAVTIRRQPIWPVGQAVSLVSDTSDTLTPVDLLDLRCPMVGPVVTPDRKVQGCCSSLLNLRERNPVLLGDLSTESLRSISTRMLSHSHYQLLKTFGVRPLLSAINRTSAASRLRPSYTDVCHLCHHIHSDALLRDVVLKTLPRQAINVDRHELQQQ
jgi:hypothetical protein